MAKDWLVSVVGSAVLISSVPTGVPLTTACAPRVAIEAAVDTFHSTVTVTPVIVALAGIVASLGDGYWGGPADPVRLHGADERLGDDDCPERTVPAPEPLPGPGHVAGGPVHEG